MCGIVGEYRLKLEPGKPVPIKAMDMERMCEAMAHRGPNHQGIRTFPRAGLGYRRLSVIDLSAEGNQPLTNEAETLWAVFNGEIYNFAALRRQLIDLGHRFRSKTDGEVIIHGFEQWGTQVFSRLEGMFTVALYDPAQHRLLIARDPFGIKPLYLFRTPQSLFFASEIKSFCTLGVFSARLNHAALAPYLTLGYVPAPATLFDGVTKLMPGTYLEIHEGKEQQTRYFDLNDAPATDLKTDLELLTDLKTELKRQIESALVSDVPLGLFLSGGLDSTLLTWYAQDHLMATTQTPVKTFSVGFQNYPSFNETQKSSWVAQQLGTEHYSLNIEEEASRVLPKVINALEEPLADPSIIPTFHLAALTKGFVTVALSGEGGDELFGGYNRYFWQQQLHTGWANTAQRLAPLLLPLLKLLPKGERHGWQNLARRAEKFLMTQRLPKLERYLSWFALLPRDLAAELLSANDGAFLLQNPFATVAARAGKGSALQEAQYIDINTMLLDNLLLKADKIGMAHSLEMRVPLLNHPLAKKIFHLPDHLKINPQQTKVVQRQLIAERFGAEFAQQPKQGFEVPIGDWLRGPGRYWLESELGETALPKDLFQATAVAKLKDAHLSGAKNYGLPLFALLVLNIWRQQFKVKW